MRYTSPDEDSARWLGFPFREGDIVISTRSKTGTTWVQMICALLVFQTPDLPDALDNLSPWLDWLIRPRADVFAQLAAQPHRRFIKTHTPLDGLPADRRVTYVVTGRHPLDMAVSLYHQSDNLDREQMGRLLGHPSPPPAPADRPSLHDWLLGWIAADPDPRASLDSLPGVMAHLSGAWAKRTEPNVVLVHFDDLRADLGGQMRRLARCLGIQVSDEAWPRLEEAASFDSMRAASVATTAPVGVLKDPAAFFRRGTSGAGAEVLDRAEQRRYYRRAGDLAPADLLAWLHRPSVDRPPGPA